MDLSQISIGILIAVIAAISFGALLKGMTGLGLPMFAVPALAMIMSVEDAVILMIIPSLAANLWLVIIHRQYRNLLRPHTPFLVAGVIGALLGSWLLHSVSDQLLKIVLVIWLGLYLSQQLLNKNLMSWIHPGRKTRALFGFLAGTSQGASGISAQIIAPYFHAEGLSKNAYAFAVATTFLIFTLGQLTAVTNLELFTAERLQLGLLALLPTIIFTQLGISQSKRMSAEAFNKLLLVLFLAMEIKLIFDLFQS